MLFLSGRLRKIRLTLSLEALLLLLHRLQDLPHVVRVASLAVLHESEARMNVGRHGDCALDPDGKLVALRAHDAQQEVGGQLALKDHRVEDPLGRTFEFGPHDLELRSFGPLAHILGVARTRLAHLLERGRRPGGLQALVALGYQAVLSFFPLPYPDRFRVDLGLRRGLKPLPGDGIVRVERQGCSKAVCHVLGYLADSQGKVVFRVVHVQFLTQNNTPVNDLLKTGSNEINLWRMAKQLIYHPAKITLIQETVAGSYGITVPEMISKSRCHHITRPRQIAIYLCRQLADASWPAIGRRFGPMDHTSCIYASARTAHTMGRHGEFRKDVEVLAREIEKKWEERYAQLNDQSMQA